MRKYEQYVEAFRKANPHLSKKAQYDATQKLWNDVKKDNDFFNQKIHEFQLKGSNLESKKWQMWSKFCKNTSLTVTKQNEVEKPVAKLTNEKDNDSVESSESQPKMAKREAPKQIEVKEEINALNSRIANLKSLQNSGLSSVSINKLKKLYNQKTSKEKSSKDWRKVPLGIRKIGQISKKQFEKFLKIKDVASALKSINRGIPGRPRIEVEQPQLL